MLAVRVFTTALLSIVLTTAFAQDQRRVDSLLSVMPAERDTPRAKILKELLVEYIFVDPDKAAEYAREELDIASEIGNKDFMARAYNDLGYCVYRSSEYEQALEYQLLSKDLYEELGNQERVGALWNNMGNTYNRLGQLNKALECQMESLRIKEEIGVPEVDLAATYWNIGNIFGEIPNYEESTSYYRRAETIYARTPGTEEDLIYVRYNLALNMAAMDSLDQAMVFFQEAAEYYKAKNYHNDLAGVYQQLGQMHAEQGNTELAESYFLQTLEIGEKYGEETILGLSYRRLGRLYLKEGRNDLALRYMHDALEVSEATGVRRKMFTDYLALSEGYAAVGNFRRAYEYHVQYAELKDEILNEDNIARMNELEIKYETAERENEILVKQNEIATLENRARISKIQNTLLIFGILAFALIFGSVYYALRQRFRRTRVEKEQLDRDLAHKRKELTGFTMQLAHKNEVLEGIKEDLRRATSQGQQSTSLRGIIRSIDHNIQDDESWESFQNRFEEVHKDFNSNVKRRFPAVTSNDLRMMALIKMNLSPQEVASLLNISQEGVKKARYRLKRKMELTAQDSLDTAIHAL